MHRHGLRAAVWSGSLLTCVLLAQAAPTLPAAPSTALLTALPADLGLDADKLEAALAFARARPTDWPLDFADQERLFGTLLGPMPKTRAATNALVLRHGRIAASTGDVEAVDPCYSIAKSLLSTVTAIAVRDHRIADLDAPVGMLVHDGGYDDEPNRAVTWRQHLQQESEWAGTMWGKADDCRGREAFGQGERQPRERHAPGAFYEYNDVRINRFALSLLRIFDRAVPAVFRDEVMMPIGASTTWRWVPYATAFVERDGVRIASVSGGTRWGGGVWISTLDLARLGQLWLQRGRWGDRQLLPTDYVAAALQPSAHGPDYGFLFWLNTRQQNWPGLPANCFGMRGAGNNTVFVSPDDDLVIVWRWHAGADHADAKLCALVRAAIVR